MRFPSQVSNTIALKNSIRTETFLKSFRITRKPDYVPTLQIVLHQNHGENNSKTKVGCDVYMYMYINKKQPCLKSRSNSLEAICIYYKQPVQSRGRAG